MCTKPSPPQGLSLPLSSNHPESADPSCSPCNTPLYDQVCHFFQYIIRLNALHALFIAHFLFPCFGVDWIGSFCLFSFLQGGPVEILPFLYLGSAYHASRKDMLDMLGITALINVSANCPNHFEDSFLYKSIPVEDNHKADISSWFNEAIEFIGEHVKHFYSLCTSLTAKCERLSHLLSPEPVGGKEHKHPTPLFLHFTLWMLDLNFKKFPPKPASWLGTGSPLLNNGGYIISTSQALKKGMPPFNELQGSGPKLVL